MQTLDLAGIGIGPFNLGLAALASSHATIDCRFFEKKSSFRWHEGMILPGTTLQVPFLADLVTMVDPAHPLGFLSYLRDQKRLYKFYFYENFFIPREEYDHYCRWASERLASCVFDEEVTGLSFDRDAHHFVIASHRGAQAHQATARNIAVGVGTVPVLPQWARARPGSRLIHSSSFGLRRDELGKCRTITVVGSGQSAAECVLSLYADLTPEKIAAGYSLRWITRSAGFFPMEYSKLGLEYFTPDYMRQFHRLAVDKRREVVAGQGLLYKGISFATIAEIFDLLYERSVGGQDPGLSLYSNCEVTSLEAAAPGTAGGFVLDIRHLHLDEQTTVEADAVIAATGYRHVWPSWLESLKGEVLAVDDNGDFIVDETFRATTVATHPAANRVFVQNAETHQHGVGSPDLGLGAYRNAIILNQLLGHTHYQVDHPSAFQSFGLPGNPKRSTHEGERYAGV
ncbi:SidA/IucD/PvdA family monooxygenase [Rhizobium sp. AAP43]|uniref:SidA/IucD/PvdA family monooxygenase n=1 Tax=Rhizobium sp. AAP43 TaxID=1523420 RepID=UPI0006B951A2|nr:SidA/IucD/PvdA family monooxygenase [Rhizobium sp. AAP43]KPF42507.1 Rhizobactin siderophore biosynthesis protein RhbE [Rhizobium sp. AAP43]